MSMPIRSFFKNILSKVSKDDLNENDIVILVVGVAGSGKTSFINTVAQKHHLTVERSLSGSTKKVAHFRCTPKTGLPVVFVDTSPFFDPIVQEWIKTNQSKVKGIIYLQPIAANRAKPEEDFCKLQLENVPTILITTHWKKERNQSYESRMEELEANWKYKCIPGPPPRRYDGTPDAAWDIVVAILPGIDQPLEQSDDLSFQSDVQSTTATEEQFILSECIPPPVLENLNALRPRSSLVSFAGPTIPSDSEKGNETLSLRRYTSGASIGASLAQPLAVYSPVRKATAMQDALGPQRPTTNPTVDMSTDGVEKLTNSIGPPPILDSTVALNAGPSKGDKSGRMDTTLRRISSLRSIYPPPGSEKHSDTHSLRQSTSGNSTTTSLPPASAVSTAREAVAQEALGPSSLAQSMSDNPIEGPSAGAEKHTSHTGYIPPPVFDSTVGNSSASTQLVETPTWVDPTSSSRSTEGIRGLQSAPASGSLDTPDPETLRMAQSTDIAESKGGSTLVDTANSSYSTKPKSGAISTSLISDAKIMSIYGSSFHQTVNVYTPHQDGSSNLPHTHGTWNRAVDNKNGSAIQTDGNLQEPALNVSDERLGIGSCGTVVFKGSFQGRPVAVKKLFRDFATLAEREVSILQQADAHPNVIRYYYQETRANFLFIAIELCRASLADVIGRPNEDQWKDIALSLYPNKALEEITSGVDHLHYLNVIHRDIKPQNILISGPLRMTRNGKGSYRMLISDFGICKKLDDNQTSFLPTTYGTSSGTRGWLAPEILRITLGKEDLVEAGTVGQGKLTKSLDIFPLGCLFYYTLTKGRHPYGHEFLRDMNILMDRKDVGVLDELGEEGGQAKDLITKMLDPEPSRS